jgi:hypothetical protein
LMEPKFLLGFKLVSLILQKKICESRIMFSVSFYQSRETFKYIKYRVPYFIFDDFNDWSFFLWRMIISLLLELK